MYEFPAPENLWLRYCEWKGIKTEQAKTTIEMPYYDDGSGRTPRYYQASAINNAVEALQLKLMEHILEQVLHYQYHIKLDDFSAII